MAVGICAACTHDGETVVNMGQEVITPTNTNMPPELRLTYGHGAAGTRAGSSVQSTLFEADEQIDVFMRDATDGCVTYPTLPLTYTSNGNGTLSYDDSSNRLFWPKLLHAFEIYGVYPHGSVSSSTKITEGVFDPFTYNTDYSFTVRADQTAVADYKASDLMIGFPSDPTPDVAPCILNQDGDEGTVELDFKHRLTKILVTLPIDDKILTGIGKIVADDVAYSGTEDTKYARITLSNINRKISFKVYHATPGNDLGIAVAADEGPATVVSRGNDIAFIVPPQTIPAEPGPFITIDLIGESEEVTDTYTYSLAEPLTLEPQKVYTYNIKLDKPTVSVTVNSITPWDIIDIIPGVSTGTAGLVQ